MLENRSFDHLIGYLKQTLNPEINGLNGNETNPASTTNSSLCTVNDLGDEYNTPNAGHSFDNTHCEQYGTREYPLPPYKTPSMNGFVTCQEEFGCQTLNSIPTKDIPVSTMFVENFVLFDMWFPGFPGPTEVNRAFFHSTTSDGWCTNPDDITYIEGFPQQSLLNLLETNNVSTGVYMSDDVSTTLFFKDQRSLKALEKYHTMESFYEHCKNGTLPQYSLIEPKYFSIPLDPATDEHPSSHSIYSGEHWFSKIYDAVRNSPVWNQTAILITYDEHGGLFDHVPSPVNVVPPEKGMKCQTGPDPNFDFTRLGVRVPAYLISPLLEKGFIQHAPDDKNSHFSHSSMAKTVYDIFLPEGTPYLTDRMEAAASFKSLFTKLSEPRTDMPLNAPHVPRNPKITKYSNLEWTQPLNDLQQNFVRAYALMTQTPIPNLKNEYEASRWFQKIMKLYKETLKMKELN